MSVYRQMADGSLPTEQSDDKCLDWQQNQLKKKNAQMVDGSHMQC